MKPRILITSRPAHDIDDIWASRFPEYVYATDTEALRQSGAVVTIVPISEPEDAKVLLGAIDGLVVAGGRDINPKCYGQERGEFTQEPHDALDASDLALLRTARELEIPTLGICRGMQALNVMCGGTLNQNIAGISKEHGKVPTGFADKVRHRHRVYLEKDSWLAKNFERDEIETNSVHHQSCDKIGEGLKVTARTKDGIIEGIESVTNWHALGVQWHPELLDNPEEFFGSFVDLVREHRENHDRRSEH